ncbi:hypothetical protein pb186bvf_021036 [Paramecium bursaria]
MLFTFVSRQYIYTVQDQILILKEIEVSIQIPSFYKSSFFSR